MIGKNPIVQPPELIAPSSSLPLDESRVSDSSSLFLRNHERRRILQQSLPLIHAIERTLVDCVHEKTLVDDRVVARALACLIEETVDPSELVSFVIARLALAAVERNADKIAWRDAMRFVYNAVKSQSDLEPGEYTYLIYTAAIHSKNDA